MKKNMKSVFENVFSKEKNYDQILNIIIATNQEKKEIKEVKLPKYALAMGMTAGAITLAYFAGKMWTNNKSLNLKMN